MTPPTDKEEQECYKCICHGFSAQLIWIQACKAHKNLEHVQISYTGKRIKRLETEKIGTEATFIASPSASSLVTQPQSDNKKMVRLLQTTANGRATTTVVNDKLRTVTTCLLCEVVHVFS
ncbi:hypothetical protein HA466_0142810 [Hirschfeldia incana]|nr:hypothetical protein HA466_0142810 [Hirschfeldia incana]KAJ0250077.1 hypothetical protein HA466_0142810 [Hirschfeldia incana]KAJ0250078.1 hypothetical protein HA466_0142810 [Hirschfeldia incana]KAJ0250079.1 hypothetical protein HA466_0142810 [Hirschfeldia incana]KAJ0250080.1 hypothetical protein HA466_0142810 [Hirschfeldia incana]